MGLICRHLSNAEIRMIVTPFSPHFPTAEKAMCSISSSRKKIPFRLLRISWIVLLEVSHARALLVPLGESPVADNEDLLEIRYHGADLRFPGTVDLNAVFILLRSLQGL